MAKKVQPQKMGTSLVRIISLTLCSGLSMNETPVLAITSRFEVIQIKIAGNSSSVSR